MRIITIRVRPVLVKGLFTRMIIMITTGVFKIEVGSGQIIGDGHSFEECSFRRIHSFQTRSNCKGIGKGAIFSGDAFRKHDFEEDAAYFDPASGLPSAHEWSRW